MELATFINKSAAKAALHKLKEEFSNITPSFHRGGLQGYTADVLDSSGTYIRTVTEKELDWNYAK